ncbi:MAG: hypothetical protein M1818_007269 [Claussenomyces sp. TS43310]|nr:MAG: hypothetical protein M1818_007269 [Claussenomyces sp. TS43310]
MSDLSQSHPSAIIETKTALPEPRGDAISRHDSPSSSSSPSSTDEYPPQDRLSRPKLGTRKSSGTIIVPRDDPNVELKEGDEVFDADDARAMSPRRNSEDLEKMSQEARAELSQHAKNLHDSLLTIFNRIEAVKEEHDKLDSNNKFLQKYIGDLMSTSKITAGGAAGGRKK